ncbi:MAG: METTL5 family protein [Sulfolobales archaeon]
MRKRNISHREFFDKKSLEIFIQRIPGFKRPLKKYEQYITPSWLVAEIITEAYLRDDIKNRFIADLGCGTGRISMASAYVGAERVLCLDISCGDLETVNILSRELKMDHVVDVVCWDINYEIPVKVDTTIMNPPFGVYRRGYDLLFLERAFDISRRTIYSIHKYNKRSMKLIYERARRRSFEMNILGIYDMEIPAIFETHRRRVYRFKVAVVYFRRVF